MAVAEEGGLDLDEPIMESSGISSRREAGLSMRIMTAFTSSFLAMSDIFFRR